MAHFYFLDPSIVMKVGALVTLDGPEGRHAATVSRIRVGEVLRVGNGQGVMGTGVVSSTGKDSLTVLLEQVEEIARLSPEIVLVQALAKTDRDERAVEMATELGISRVIPWMADRSISRWDPNKADKGRQKWQAIAREASKQSIRAHIPLIEAACTTAQLLQQFAPEQLLVLDPRGDMSVSDASLAVEGVVVVVGPEGGLSDAELATFRHAGAHIVTVGTNILRTSTAGPVAVAVLNSRLGRL